MTFRSDVESEVYLVDGRDNSIQSLGKTPLRLVDPTLPLFVSFRKAGYQTVDLIAFDESVFGEVIDVKLGPPGKKPPSEYVKTETSYIDYLARAHRMFLRGQLSDARRTLDHLEQVTGARGPSALALRGHIELLEGQVEKALGYYQAVDQLALILKDPKTKGGTPDSQK